jgi:hypothetical protein
MDNQDTKRRVFVIIGSVIFLLIFIGATFSLYSNDKLIWTFYPGLFVGIILAVLTCMSISEQWDPKTLSPKPSVQNKSQGAPWTWGPPLGVLTGNIVVQFFGDGFQDLIWGVTVGWLCLLFSYLIIQVWRY